jgi:phenylpropionate dioxygenase-like ring-hydroxylating dioxygenase large terminal subunit
MRSNWVIAAHHCELANHGDFVLLPWQRGELALTNIDGEVIAFDNLCPHRGARIFAGMHGNSPPVCRYHGRCAKPSQLNRFKVSSKNGFVFVSEDADPLVLPDGLSAFIGAMPRLSLHSTLTFTMDCDWTVAVENALDFEHVTHVHATSLAKLALLRARQHTWGDGSSLESFTSLAGMRRMKPLFPHERDFDYVHAHFFPFTCLSSTRGWTYSLQNYFPRADGKTTFVHRLYATPTTRRVDSFLDSAAKMNSQVFFEDADICATVAPHHRSKLGPADSRIAHFRSYL